MTKEIAMNENPVDSSIDLERIERTAYESKWEDGLIDIFVGVALLGMGIAWLTDYAVFGGILPALLVPIWVSARKRITVPRTGHVEFSGERKALEKRNLNVVALLGLVFLVMGVLVYFLVRENPPSVDTMIRGAIPALPSVLLGIGAVMIGFLFGIRRFLGYSALLVASGVVGGFLQVHPGWLFLPAGAVTSTVGLVLVIDFLRKYPVPDPGASA